MSAPLLCAQALCHTYPEADRPALDNLTLSIEAGCFTAIVGANGSGKSTLAKHFNAIVTPTKGRMLVDGMDTADETLLPRIRRTVGMVFQNPDNQLVANVVEDDVAFAPENLGLPPAEIRRRVDEALALTGMTDFRLHAPHLLSGGQKQRVAIAGVLAMRPQVLVLDEPTAMLDPLGRQEVLRTILRLRSEGITVIFITHHMDEAAQADRLIILDKGHLFADGTPAELFPRADALRKVGLSVPEETELLQTLARAGLPLEPALTDVEGCAQRIAEVLCRN